MRDAEVVRFLQWALPRLRMRWSGLRKVRGQVAKLGDYVETRHPDIALDPVRSMTTFGGVFLRGPPSPLSLLAARSTGTARQVVPAF